MNLLNEYVNAYNKLLLEGKDFIDITYSKISVSTTDSEITKKHKKFIDDLKNKFTNKRTITIKDARQFLLKIANELSKSLNNNPNSNPNPKNKKPSSGDSGSGDNNNNQPKIQSKTTINAEQK